MQHSKRSRFKLHQCIVQVFLCCVIWHFYCKITSNTEIFNILPSSSVNDRMESVKSLYFPHHFYLLIPGYCFFFQKIIYFLKVWIMLNNTTSPRCIQYITDSFSSCLLPAFLLVSDNAQQAINIRIRFCHSLENILVNNNIRTQKV